MRTILTLTNLKHNTKETSKKMLTNNQSTINEITEGKTFKQQTQVQKDQVRERQDFLACTYQDTDNQSDRDDAFLELFDSMQALIESKVRRHSLDQGIDPEELRGDLYEELVMCLERFDRNGGVPFVALYRQYSHWVVTTYFKGNVKNVDTNHDFMNVELDKPTDSDSNDSTGEVIPDPATSYDDTLNEVLIDQLAKDCFDNDLKKETVIHMNSQGFKRSEIVRAIKNDNTNEDSLAKYVNRTVNNFRSYCVNLNKLNLI